MGEVWQETCGAWISLKTVCTLAMKCVHFIVRVEGVECICPQLRHMRCPLNRAVLARMVMCGC